MYHSTHKAVLYLSSGSMQFEMGYRWLKKCKTQVWIEKPSFNEINEGFWNLEKIIYFFYLFLLLPRTSHRIVCKRLLEECSHFVNKAMMISAQHLGVESLEICHIRCDHEDYFQYAIPAGSFLSDTLKSFLNEPLQARKWCPGAGNPNGFAGAIRNKSVWSWVNLHFNSFQAWKVQVWKAEGRWVCSAII